MKTLCLILASVFGIGFIPYAPGTAGSLLASILFVILYRPPYGEENEWQLALLGIAIILLILGTIVSWKTARTLGKKDPKQVVIDEVLGVTVAYLFLPKTYLVVISGFIIFRLLDIIKPFPAYQAQRLPGGLGIMMDDLIAGIYTNLLIRFIWSNQIATSLSIPDLF